MSTVSLLMLPLTVNHTSLGSYSFLPQRYEMDPNIEWKNPSLLGFKCRTPSAKPNVIYIYLLK